MSETTFTVYTKDSEEGTCILLAGITRSQAWELIDNLRTTYPDSPAWTEED